MAILEGDTPGATPWNRISMSQADFLDLKATLARVTSALYAMGNSGLTVRPFVSAPSSDANFLNALLDRIDDHVENIDAPPAAKVQWMLSVVDKDATTMLGDEKWTELARGECPRNEVSRLNHDVEHGNTYKVVVHERGLVIPELTRQFSV